MQANGIASAVLFSCLLIAASVWDMRKRLIPDNLCLGIVVAGMLTFSPEKPFGILLGLPLLIAALIKEGGMGGGDVKFVSACGFVLGLPIGSIGLVMGLLAALMWHIATNVVCRLKQGAVIPAKVSSLPLAPFLSFGFVMAYTLQ